LQWASPEDVLSEIAKYGFQAIEAGPTGFLPADPMAAQELLQRFSLTLLGSFIALPLHKSVGSAIDLAPLRQLAGSLAALGATTLVLGAAGASGGYNTRVELTEHEWSNLIWNLEMADRIVSQAGLSLALHPHFGTAIETQSDIDRLCRATPIKFCLDTGHLLAGGSDPRATAISLSDRIIHVHLKDINGDLAEIVARRELPYEMAIERGLFLPLGDGSAEISAVVDTLERLGYRGHYVFEQDRPAHEISFEAARTDLARSMTYWDHNCVPLLMS
jgi:inosose dehydratase